MSSKPFIELITPNGGEILTPGAEHKISWESEGVDEVNIEFSSDDGKSWTTVFDLPGSQENLSEKPIRILRWRFFIRRRFPRVFSQHYNRLAKHGVTGLGRLGWPVCAGA